jgi:ribonuclease HI
MAKLVDHVHDPLVAEIVALWMAIIFCKEVGASQVEFEGDSLGVVQEVNSGSSGWSFYGHLIDDIRTPPVEFPSSIVRHVKRSANQATHELAKLIVHQSLDYVWNRCCSDLI